MRRSLATMLLIGLMIVVIISVDLMFFRNHFWERLIANIGIVMVFVAFYLRLFR